MKNFEFLTKITYSISKKKINLKNIEGDIFSKLDRVDNYVDMLKIFGKNILIIFQNYFWNITIIFSNITL